METKEAEKVLTENFHKLGLEDIYKKKPTEIEIVHYEPKHKNSGMWTFEEDKLIVLLEGPSIDSATKNIVSYFAMVKSWHNQNYNRYEIFRLIGVFGIAFLGLVPFLVLRDRYYFLSLILTIIELLCLIFIYYKHEKKIKNVEREYKKIIKKTSFDYEKEELERNAKKQFYKKHALRIVIVVFSLWMIFLIIAIIFRDVFSV